MYEIDNDIPQPSKKARKSKVAALPFAQLEPGQSFHVPTDEASHKAEAAKLSAYARLASQRLRARFSLRSVSSDDLRGPGLRIWRLEGNLDTLFAQAAPTFKSEADGDNYDAATFGPVTETLIKPKRVRKAKKEV